MTHFKKFISLVTITLSLLGAISVNLTAVFAQDNVIQVPPINPVEEKILLPGVSGASDEGQYIRNSLLPTITRTIIAAAGGLSLLFMIVGGLQILLAAGNDDKITKAKHTILWALVGMLIAILSYGIVQAIVSIRLFGT